MNTDYFRNPNDEEIDLAERTLNFSFHPDYRAFLKSGGDVANATFEPAVVLPGSGHLDLFEIANSAWTVDGVPKDLLPFVSDNGDYFCINSRGEVVYWSHNCAVDEKWSTLAAWHQQVCVERK